MARREDVLNALSQVARKFRTQVGESLATVEKHSTPLAEATTPSLEALKAYSTGMKVIVSSGNAAAIPSSGALSKSIPNSPWRTPNLGLSYSAVGESVLSAESTTRAWQLRDRVSDREKIFHRLHLRPAGDGKSGKGVPNPRVVASDLSSRGSHQVPRFVEAAFPPMGQADLNERSRHPEKKSRTIPTLCSAYGNLASSYFSWTASPKPRVRFNEPPNVSWRILSILVLRYNIAVLKGDKDQMDRIVALAKGKHGAEHSVAHAEALALARSGRLALPPGGHRAAPWIWPCKRANARRQRVTRPHERCGKPFAGMLPKRKGTRRRRWRFRTAGMSNTPPALPWLFRETFLDHKRSPMIWKALPGRYVRQIYLRAGSSRVSRTGDAASLQTAWSGCKSLCPMSWR